jgi:hypothetical protein
MPAKKEVPQRSSLPLIIGVSGGVAVGLILVVGGYWFITSGSKNEPTATSSPPATMSAAANAPPVSPPPVQPETVALETAQVPAVAVDTPAPATQASAAPETTAETPFAQSPNLARETVDPRIEVFRLPSPTWAMSYDSASGQLALIDDSRNGIVIYNIDQMLAGKGEPEHVIETEGPATAVCFKALDDQRVLAVTSQRMSAIKFYDAGTFEPIGDFPLPETYYVGRLMASANPADEGVYYSISGRFNNLEIERDKVKLRGRIDCQTFEEGDDYVPKEGTSLSIKGMAINADGSVIQHRAPSNFVKISRDSSSREGLGGELPPREGEFIHHHVAGPFGSLLAVGFASGSPTFEPLAYFRERPMAVGVHETEIAIGSANDYRALASVPMPAEWLPKMPTDWHDRQMAEDSNRELDFRAKVFYARDSLPKFLRVATDDSRKLAIFVFHSAIVIAPLDRFELPEEPSLLVKNVIPYDLYVGKPVSVPLECGADGAKFELVSFSHDSNPPVVEGNVLNWTPSPQHVGRHQIRLRAKLGEAKHEWEWPVRISRAPIEIPFMVTGLTIEPEERQQAAVWGFIDKDPAPDKVERSWFLGTVNLKTEKLLAHRPLNRPVVHAAITLNDVYALASTQYDETYRRAAPGTQLVRLNASDLKSQNHVVLPKEASEFIVVGDRYLIAVNDAVPRYTLPELKAIDSPFQGLRSGEGYGRIREGWLWDGVLWDDALKTPQLLVDPKQFAHAYHHRERVSKFSDIPIRINGTIDFDDRGALQFVDANARSRHPDDRDSSPTVHLIPPPLDYRFFSFGGISNKKVEWGKDRLAILFNGKVFSVPFSDFPLKEEPAFEIEPVQSTFVLTPTKPTRVSYKAEGATQYSIELRATPNGVEPQFTASSDDGAFTLDLKPFSERLVPAAVEAIIGQNWNVYGEKEKGLERLKQYLEAVASPYRELTKRRPRGVPILIYATVQAQSAAGQQATLHHCYFVEIPLALMRDAADGGTGR